MANKIGRILIGIIVLAAIAVGIYYILPGNIKNPLTATLQSNTNDNYAPIVDALKGATIPKNKGITYDSKISVQDSNAWTIKEISVDDAGNGSYDVYADAYKVTVSVENNTNDTGMVTHTNAHIRLTFHVNKNGSEIKIGDKVVEAGKAATPSEIDVAESHYTSSDEYFQPILNCLAGL